MRWRFLMSNKPIAVKLAPSSKNIKPNLPAFQTPGSAAVDLVAAVAYRIPPHTTVTIDTTFKWELPEGIVGLVCSRSGLAAKHSVFVLNAPGVIDSDFRGTVAVILHNSGGLDFTVQPGDRIAQMLFVKCETDINFEVVTPDDLNKTTRGESGFGSTGK